MAMIADLLSWIIIIIVFIMLLSNRYYELILFVIFIIPFFSITETKEIFLRGNVVRPAILLTIISLFFNKNHFIIPHLGVINTYIYFIIFSIISGLLSLYPLEAVYRAITWVVPYLCIIFSIVISYNFEDGFDRINKTIILSSLIVLLFAIQEIITQTHILYDLGFTRSYSVSYILEKRFFSLGRVSSFIGQPVYTAFYFLVILTLALFYYRSSSRNRKIYYLIFSIIIFITSILTGTRAILISHFTFIILYFVLFNRYYKLKIILGLVLVGIILYLSLPKISNELFYLNESFTMSTYTEKNANFIQRIELSNRLINLAGQNILFGFGPGIIQKMAFGDYLSYNFQFEGLAGLENHFAVILADTGLIGFIFYMFFIFKNFRFIIISKSKINKLMYYREILLALLPAFFIGSFTVYNLSSVPMLILLLMVGNYYGKFYRELEKNNE